MTDHGVYTRADLDRHGISGRALRRALADGRVTRPARGWYARADADPRVVDAVTGHGAVSCLTALSMHGVWVPPHDKELHLRGNSQATRANPERYCSQYGRPEPVHAPVDHPILALRHAIRCVDRDEIIAICDSMLNRYWRSQAGEPDTDEALPTPTAIRAAFADAPAEVRARLDWCDARAQSGTESLVRVRLRGNGIAVRSQVHIPGLGHVDLLAGELLIIEVDSRAHHTGAENYQEDRRRDQVSASSGYLRMRVTYADVVHHWPATEARILKAIRARHHRAPRRRKTS
ncbi:type IV toxin-antitoxin system AbiEi family antitoxin domain-containing protein [Gordonia sp. NB41Y]|uniref:type IV toxin-antitoxin system AbiEi family antitoxin domain-containing protein n=1 Tax=Gordonia sp. NB41Y TaxID=875808 RepID=UPI0006B1900F|nr:type IV toxin-antitoxin system AbiEi family antitoxin domain-containing protein [Gordonia sp. NB41Y]EMP12014.2 hypothetical protein ISGA_4145 [Gordonia sp. NB41Y]WLP92201.1 hypothetical protein Q9K23_08225 [Gordonia sp. NB41Y]